MQPSHPRKSQGQFVPGERSGLRRPEGLGLKKRAIPSSLIFFGGCSVGPGLLLKDPGGGGGAVWGPGQPRPTHPLCDIPSGCCSFTGPWTVTRSSLRMLRRVATFCRPLRPVLLLVSFPRSRSPVVGVLGLC